MLDSPRFCARREQIVRGNPCLFGDAPQQLGGRSVHSIRQVRHRRLTHANPLRKFRLRDFVGIEVQAERFHMEMENIGFPYPFAIGGPYAQMVENLRMQKSARTFYDRAWEAMSERWPKQKPTQKRLAKLFGVAQPTVSQEYKDKGGVPAHEKVVRFALQTGVCVEWLYTERGPKYPTGKLETEDQDLAPVLMDWPTLPQEIRRRIISYADFVRDEKGK